MNFKRTIVLMLFIAAVGLSTQARAQFRNSGIYLPQLGYMSLELINGPEKFGSSDSGYFGVGGLNSLGYNFWITYRLWVGFSAATGNHTGSDVMGQLSVIPGFRYNFLDEEFRPYTELGFQYLQFFLNDGNNVPQIGGKDGQPIFGAIRPAVGCEWFIAEEMSLTAEAAYHLYPFRYKKEHFNNAPRSKFLAALSAEGVPCSGGYGPQYRDGLMEDFLNSKNFTRGFPKARFDKYRQELDYPDNDRLCEEAVWIGQNMLLGSKSDTGDIADAILKISENRDKLA